MKPTRARADRAEGRARKARAETTPVPLSELASGAVGRFQNTSLAKNDTAWLRALGLTARSLIRVCKAGDPCIVQVRTTRIGLSREVAANILVVPEASR